MIGADDDDGAAADADDGAPATFELELETLCGVDEVGDGTGDGDGPGDCIESVGDAGIGDICGFETATGVGDSIGFEFAAAGVATIVANSC